MEDGLNEALGVPKKKAGVQFFTFQRASLPS
jgi:hypothetical protein